MYKEKILFEISKYKIQDNAKILNYTEELFEEMESLLFVDKDTLLFPIYRKVLGIEAKLLMIREALKYNFFDLDTEEEVIKLIETDYMTYMIELCGYNRNEQVATSIIFMPE